MKKSLAVGEAKCQCRSGSHGRNAGVFCAASRNHPTPDPSSWPPRSLTVASWEHSAGRLQTQSLTSFKDRVNREGQCEPWLICKEHPRPSIARSMLDDAEPKRDKQRGWPVYGKVGLLVACNFEDCLMKPIGNRLVADVDVAGCSHLCP